MHALGENPHGQKFTLQNVDPRHDDRDLQVWYGKVGFDISYKGEKITGLEDDVRRLTDPALTLDQRFEEIGRLNDKYSSARKEGSGMRSSVRFDAADCTITLNVYNNGSASFSMGIKNVPSAPHVTEVTETRHTLDDFFDGSKD